MRLITLIILASILQVSALTFGQNITINRKNAPLESVLKDIRAQSGYDFVYDGKVLPQNATVNAVEKNATIEKVLTDLFKELPLTYTVEGKIISIRRRTTGIGTASESKNIDVHGTVVNIDGKPLAGATVNIEGTAIGTTTNEKGEFSLKKIDETSVLRISFIGYQAIDIQAVPNVGNVIMKISNGQLQEVVIRYSNGYQEISSERSAGSFAKPDLDIMRNRSGSVNLLQRLDGLVPGLTINNAPSAVASGSTFLVRGLTSINASRAPLIVVDGIEFPVTSIESINMQDVDDITILKDATSASIWGAKAANGVIVITTKKGKNSDKLRIDYDSYFLFEGRPDLGYLPKLNSRQFITTAEQLFTRSVADNPWGGVEAIAPVTPHLQIEYDRYRGIISASTAKTKLDSLAAIDNASQIKNLFYRDAATMNHTLSVSGGGKVYTFYASVNYIKLQSDTPGQTDNRYKINLRQDFNFNKRFQAYLITDLNNTTTSSTNLTIPGSDVVPYQLFQSANGDPMIVNSLGLYSDSLRMDYQARSHVNLDYSPLGDASQGYTKGTSLSGRIVAGARVNLIKGLRFEGTYGYNVLSTNLRDVLDQNAYAVRTELMNATVSPTLTSVPVYYLPTSGGRLTTVNGLTKSWTVRNQLVYDLNFNDNQITALFGQEATSSTPVTSWAIYRGWDDQLQVSRPVDYAALAAGITGTVPGNTFTLGNNLGGGEGVITRTTSYYSNVSYSYLKKYTFNASWRIDQSNLFGFDQSAQNRPVWSTGGKWAIGREDFMKQLTWLDKLDIRATYGITGNAPIPGQAASFDILAAQSNVNYVTGAGLVLNTPANKKLTWEETVTYNGGFDFGIFQDRLSGSFDAYIKKTSNLIGFLPVAPLNGYSSVIGNLGNMENRGVELGLNSVNIASKSFLWSTGFTFAYDKNKITHLDYTSPITTGAGMINARYLQGYPAFTTFAYNYAGLNSSGDPQIRLANGTLTSAPNSTVAADVLYMGTSQPVWNGGLSNNFRYEDFQLGINVSYSGGNVLFRNSNTYWGGNGVLYTDNISPDFLNRWQKQGDEATTQVPRFASTATIANNRDINYYMFANTHIINGAYAKVRDITLSYSLPKAFVNSINIQGITFRVQVNNIMLWKANSYGIDPEFITSTGDRILKTGQGTVTLGAHVTF